MVTTDGRVLVADRYLAAWQDETGELPGPARDVQFVWQDEHIYVCTASAGVYRFRPVISAVGDVPVADGPRLAAWPNPFNPRANLRSELPRAAVGRLAIYDLAGRLVTILREGSFPAGMHTNTWDAAGQASGAYLARLETDLGTVATRLVLVR